jgi:di/tripeptidase
MTDDIARIAAGLTTDLAEQLRSHIPSMRRYALDHAAHYAELAADKIAALEAEVGKYRNLAKQNNNLAKMYKAQADEFRAKYVAIAGGSNRD